MERIQIELDRPSGVYYAGETVSGTVKIIPKKGETCRSVLLRLVGKAKCKWATGHGDKRKVYEGSKIFLHSERTLWGKFYRTAILNEVGENAIFGGAVNDGTIFIPCMPTEGPTAGGPMKIIIRVNDYDWGKKDDILGEIFIDATELVRTKGSDAVNLPLTRNGKPEKGEITMAARFVPTSTIMPLSNVGKGQGETTASKECLILTILSAKGLRKADWFSENDVYVQAHRPPDQFFAGPTPGKKLPVPAKVIALFQDTGSFKFAFPTRTDSPGSANLRTGATSYIAYYLYAKIDKVMWRDPSKKRPIIILPSRPAPLPELLTSAKAQVGPDLVYENQCCCFKCGELGTVEIKLNLQRLAFAPGEKIDFSGTEVVNNSKSPLQIRFILKRTVRLSTTGPYKIASVTSSTGFLLGTHVVPAHSTFCFAMSSPPSCIVPAVAPSFFGARGLPNALREPIVFSYAIVLAAKVGSMVRASLPVLISAIPPKSEAIEAAKTLITPPDILQISRYAVLNDNPCDTVPIITGYEDAGGGSIVPEASGPVSIFSRDEDSGSVGNSALMQPMVLSYNSIAPVNHSNAENESAMLFVSDNSTATKPENSDLGAILESNIDVDPASAREELLSDLSSSVSDSRAAVDQWTKKYPSVASSLSATQFAEIIKKVSFSFEQASVARELLAGIPNGITTDYILTCMHECPFSKFDLAKAMAPYVKDPLNKDVVLDELYSFEKDDVSKLFP